MLPEFKYVVQNIKVRRIRLNWSQSRLAKEAKVSQSLVAKMEKHLTVPNYESIQKMDQALEIGAQEGGRTIDKIANSIVWVGVGDEVGKAVRIMKQKDFSQLPVMDGKKYVGNVSVGGLIGVSPNTKIRDVLEPLFMVVQGNRPIALVREMVKKEGLKAVLVEEGGEVYGIVTAHDLI